MAGVQKVRLNQLNMNIKNALIVGIVIAKNSPRTIGSKKKSGESRGVTSFTVRDSDVDTINVDVWGSEYFVLTFYERFLVGDVVEITSPKICVKTGDNEIYRPHLRPPVKKHAAGVPNVTPAESVFREYLWIGWTQNSKFRAQLHEMSTNYLSSRNPEMRQHSAGVTSPFYLTLNEGMSDVSIHSGDTFSMYLPLLHIPTKQSSGYYGLAEVLKLPEESNNVYVDLLVVVKTVKPAKTIKTRAGVDMSVRGVEIMDNTTPAWLLLDIFDIDSIQRAEEWRPLESVLFIADARVSWRARAVSVQVCAKTVITHQPHTADAEALRLHIRNQATARGGEAAAWAAWSGERSCAASVSQVRDRVAGAAPFCASLHALLTHLDLDELDTLENNTEDNIRVRFADHTGELTARLPANVLEETLGYSIEQLKAMPAENRSAVRWTILLEQCTVKLAASPPRLIVLALRRATQADPIPLY